MFKLIFSLFTRLASKFWTTGNGGQLPKLNSWARHEDEITENAINIEKNIFKVTNKLLSLAGYINSLPELFCIIRTSFGTQSLRRFVSI